MAKKHGFYHLRDVPCPRCTTNRLADEVVPEWSSEARDQAWERGGDGDISAGVSRLIMGR